MLVIIGECDEIPIPTIEVAVSLNFIKQATDTASS